MRKAWMLGVSALLAAALIIPAAVAAAPPTPGQNWGKSVNASACSGTLIINVTLSVTNDADSGLASYWAYDNYQRQVQVWQTAPGSFCVVSRYEGQFTTVAGLSPAGTATTTIAAGHMGTMTGGYQYTFDGVLNASPVYATAGNIGTFNYGWDGTQTGAGSLTLFSWMSTYFSSTTNWTYNFWGWVYQGGSCGTWYNNSLGTSSGDISC